MGKPTGFLEYNRKTTAEKAPLDRIQDFEPFHPSMDIPQLKEQSARCMNCGTPFCHSGVNWQGVVSGCPLGNLIPEWNDLVYKGLYHEAWLRLRLTSPFPEFTSRVCPALCEGACACGENGEAVTVREIERFLSDMSFEQGWEKPRPPKVRTGKKIAVVGSGPSGLACAYRLNRLGHNVTVFEKNELPGGLLMFGIPNMKLPKSVVLRRTELLEQEGVTFQFNADIGSDGAAEQLKGFDAIALCCGAEAPRDLKAPGRELEGIQFAVPYLADATRKAMSGHGSDRPLFGKCVVIIGGGDTGNDCTGTAIRQGAMKVVQLEIMPPSPQCRADGNPWPRWPFVFKTDYGQQEAIAVWGHDPREFTVNTTEFIGENGHVKAINTVKVEWVNKDGRRVPVSIPGTEKTYSADLVLIAMGFSGPKDYILKALGEGRGPENGVFTCGDMRTGQSLVVKAMSDGLNTAEQIDEFLKL
jgi:glutamate synthase (NADPH) small chain